MTGAPDVDLTGQWKGIFNYPRLLPPTEFDAELRDVGGAISGVTSEPDTRPGRSGSLHAVLEGSHEGAEIRFRKIYDDLRDANRTVHYRGTIEPGGDEISGQWDIRGFWSGTFLMVRAGGKAVEVERRMTEEILGSAPRFADL